MTSTIMSSFIDVPAEIDRLLEQIYAGTRCEKPAEFLDLVFNFDPQKVYIVTITFKIRNYLLNAWNYYRVLSILKPYTEKAYLYLCPAYQSDYVIHFHGLVIPHPEKGVGLTLMKRLRADLNRNIGFCKITNIKRDNKAKIYNHKEALLHAIDYFYSEDNFGGCEEFKIISNIKAPLR